MSYESLIIITGTENRNDSYRRWRSRNEVK